MTSAISFAQYARARRPHIEKHLRSVLNIHALEGKQLSTEYQELYSELMVLLRRGGKRLRPLLYLLTYEGYGGRHTSAALEVAVSFELLHAFLLMHDDVIDRDYHRWGGLNIAGVYFEKYSRNLAPREAMHMAEAQATLAGDICLSLAQAELANCDFEPALVKQLQQLQHHMLQRVLAGELTDLTQSQSPVLPTEAAVLTMYAEKTSSYSFVLPLVAAAMSAGVDNDIARMQTIGEKLGTAYQLQDDLRSIFAKQAATGKSVAGDLREGKRTVLLIKTLELATPKQCQQLEAIMRQDLLSAADITTAQKIMKTSGARDYVQALIGTYTAQALAELQNTELSVAVKDCLQQLIQTQLSSR